MYVYNFKGEFVVSTKRELLSILNERSDSNANHFILTFNDSGFPQLSIFAKNDFCVIYFLGEDGESYVSFSKENKSNDTHIFYEDENDTEIEIACECVINIDKMLDVAAVFFDNQNRSDLIEWMEL
jgi:hypothetical protein